jgi:hypothetical protein
MKSIKKETSDRIEYTNEQGLLHRIDGPAIEYTQYNDGTTEWWFNGELHRTDGPAVVWRSGDKSWFIKGKRHREDGPAIENKDGSKSWFLNGLRYSEEGWKQEVTKIKLKRILDL